MPTWKKILTEDSPAPNLGNSDLVMTGSGSTNLRTFDIASGATSGALVFRGTYGDGSLKTFLRIETDNDQALTDQNYVYASTLRVGNFSINGTAAQPGYNLPLHDASAGAGKIIATTGSWTSSEGQTDFVSFDQWMNPDYTGKGFTSEQPFSPTGAEPRLDKVIVWDNSDSAYKACAIRDLDSAIGRNYVFSYGRSAQGATSGTLAMRTANGVEGTGYVTLHDSRIVGVSYAGVFSGLSAGDTVSAGVRIDINGSDSGFDVDQLVNVSNGTHSGKTGISSPISVNAGDRIDCKVDFSGESGGTVDEQSVVIYLDTHNTFSEILTVP